MPRRSYHYHDRHRSFLVWFVAVFLAWSPFARAHPFGTDSVNRYLGVEGTRSGVRLAYLLDFAELPATRELDVLDRNGDGAVTPAERDAYLDALLPRLMANWNVSINGRAAALRVVHRSIEAPPGQGGLSTLRILCEVSANGAATDDGVMVVTVRDTALAERSGYRDIQADDSPDATLVARDEPARGPGRSMGGSLRRVNQARYTFRLRGAPRRAPDRRTAITIAAAALLGLLAFALMRSGPVLDARVRILIAVATAIATSTTPLGDRAGLGLMAVAVVTQLIAAKPRAVWAVSRCAIAGVWGLAVCASSRALANAPWSTAVSTGLRITIAIAAVLPVAASLSLDRTARALSGLGLPRLLVDVTVATARGVTILRDEAERLARARSLRAPAAGVITRVGMYGTLVSTLFARGLARAEHSHLALVLRGFDTEPPGQHPAPPFRHIAALVLWVGYAIVARSVR